MSSNLPMEETEDSDEFFEKFSKEIREVDEVVNVVLKGHLLVERALDRIISLIFFHPDYILNGRQSFERKVQIARAMSLNAHDHHHWDLILSVNSLRNEIAHKHPGDERKKKTERVRQASVESITSKASELHRNDTDSGIIIFACSMCCGFLAYTEDDLEDLRKEINSMIAEHHTDQ